ncbi:hypothetical protein [Bosea sp. FBZP-16]|uniref:hypothetical protein n=1 Tax=Bosea sp. FBZP-16 TaxID=2065382 RepID=UPI0020BDBF76|nr:hypothetical protein [Bosea sp. FBZP-16]
MSFDRHDASARSKPSSRQREINRLCERGYDRIAYHEEYDANPRPPQWQGHASARQDRANARQILDRVGQMRAQSVGSFVLIAAREAVENGEMLLALRAVTLAVQHRPVGQQAAHAIEPPDRIEEERVAARSDDRLMEAHPALVQRVSGIGLDRARGAISVIMRFASIAGHSDP